MSSSSLKMDMFDTSSNEKQVNNNVQYHKNNNLSSTSPYLPLGSDNYSATSYDHQVPQTGGGFLDFFTKKNGKLAVTACNEKAFEALSFMIRHGVITDYSDCTHVDGGNLFHCVVTNITSIPHINDVLNKMLNSGCDLHKLLNHRNNFGQTPLFLAVIAGNDVLANLLVSKGAMPKIPDNEGNYIYTSDEDCDSDTHKTNSNHDANTNTNTNTNTGNKRIVVADIFVTKNSVQPKSKKSRELSDNRNNDPLVEFLRSLHTANNDSAVSTDMPTHMDTDAFLQSDKFLKKENMHNDSNSESSYSNSKFIKKIMFKPPHRGNMNDTHNTWQMGGNNEVIKGSRRMNLYSDYEKIHGGNSDSSNSDSSESSNTKTQHSMSRHIEEQRKNIYDRTIKRIMELMNTDKEHAKAYHGIIYNRLKEKNPTGQGYDRIVEVEKMATKEYLSKIDIEKEMAAYREKRESSSDSETAKKSEKKQKDNKESKKQSKQSRSTPSSSSGSSKSSSTNKSSTTSSFDSLSTHT